MEKDHRFIASVCLFIATFGYVGLWTKRGQGTVASFVSLLICLSFPSQGGFLVLTILTFVLGLASCAYLYYNKFIDKDPRYVVIDEACAMFFGSFSLFFFLGHVSNLILIVNFVLFRIFDIWKPQPIRFTEAFMKKKSYTTALGIIIDDLLAASISVCLSWLIFDLFA